MVEQALAAVPQIINYQSQFMKSPTEYETRDLDLRVSFWREPGYESGDVTNGSGAININAVNYGGFQQEFLDVLPTTEGIVNLQIGLGVVLPTLDPNIHKYLQVEAKLTGEADNAYEILDPAGTLGDGDDRRALLSTPYSLYADMLNGRRVGTASGDLVILNTENTFEKSMIPGGTNANVFRLDDELNAGTGSIALEFGSLGALVFDAGEEIFEFNRSIDFGKYQVVDFVLQNAAETISDAVSGQVMFNTTTKKVQFYNGNAWITLDNASASGSIAASLVLTPQWAGEVIKEDGTNNIGILTSDFENLDDDIHSYYKWTSNETTLIDIDVMAKIKLPDNFVQFSATDSISVEYKTATGSGAQNNIEVTVFGDDGNELTLLESNTLISPTWMVQNYTFSGATFEAGDDMMVKFKLSAKDGNAVKVGDVVLHYFQ